MSKVIDNIEDIDSIDSKSTIASPTFTGTVTINGGRALDDDTVAYNVDTSLFIANTLTSGAIIERGSNANGEYIKFADGTLICRTTKSPTVVLAMSYGSIYYGSSFVFLFPSSFISNPDVSITVKGAGGGLGWACAATSDETSTTSFETLIASPVSRSTTIFVISAIAIGRWK